MESAAERQLFDLVPNVADGGGSVLARAACFQGSCYTGLNPPSGDQNSQACYRACAQLVVSLQKGFQAFPAHRRLCSVLRADLKNEYVLPWSFHVGRRCVGSRTGLGGFEDQAAREGTGTKLVGLLLEDGPSDQNCKIQKMCSGRWPI